MYVLFKCFDFKEGYQNNSKKGYELRKIICKALVSTNVKKVNIRNYDYENGHICKNNNFYFVTKNTQENPKNDPIIGCGENVKRAKKNNTINKDILPNPNLSKNDKLSVDQLKEFMNCYILGKTNGDPTAYEKNVVTKEEIMGSSGFYEKHTMNDYKILGSYNSACVYNDGSYEGHDLDQITFLFNLGVRYFDFSVIKKKDGDLSNELLVTCKPVDGQILTPYDDKGYIKLESVIETISENINVPRGPQRNIKDLYDGLSAGAFNYKDPLFINLNICIHEQDEDFKIFNKIYKIITKYIDFGKFYTAASVHKQVNESMNNILHEPIDILKNKVILFVDIYTDYIERQENDSAELNLNKRANDFNNSELSKITAYVVYHKKYKQKIKNSINTRSKLNNYKEIEVMDAGTIDFSDNNNFYILNPVQANRCNSSHKINTYLCSVKQYFNNGINVVSFPFYLARDSETAGKLSEYYDCFNNAVNDESNSLSAIKIKNPQNLSHDSRCEVSIIPDSITNRRRTKENVVGNLKNDPAEKLMKDYTNGTPNPKLSLFKYNIKK